MTQILDCLNRELHNRERNFYQQIQKLNQCLGQPLIRSQFGDPFDRSMLETPKNQLLLIEGTLDPCYTSLENFMTIPRSMYSVYNLGAQQWHRTVDRTLSCFMHRAEPLRQFVFYKLTEKDYHRSGTISYHCWNLYSNQVDLDLFDRIHTDFYHPQYDQIHQTLRTQIPWCNFEDTGNLVDQIMRNKLHLVAESYPDRPDNLCVTEKTFRALQTPRPWLIFGASGTVDFLRSLGFYVYDDFIDHSYNQLDTSHDCSNMQNALFRELDRVITYVPTVKLFKHWESKTKSNLEIIEKWRISNPDEINFLFQRAFQQAQKLLDK